MGKWFLFMVLMCKMIISPECFFHFFKSLIFWVVRGGKRAKNNPKWQKKSVCCTWYLKNHKPYIIWLSFVVHKCKIIISPGVFFYFSRFLFFVLLGGSKGKKWQNDIKLCPQETISGTVSHCCTPYLSKHTSFDRVFCWASLNWWHLQKLFPFFQNFGFLGC